MLTDIQIAQNTKMKHIREIAESIGLSEDDIDFYGKYKAKVLPSAYKKFENKPDGKLILVTAINPTPAGEGKTTTTVGIGEAMSKLGKNAIIALREPSLGPVMGIKGGAAGGGYAQVVPMEDINLHFTGDMHAITSAHNLLAALLDNHIKQGNVLNIDTANIVYKRVMDMNDRSLRNIVIGLGGKVNGVPREDGFMITVASEVMAILCLANDFDDLKHRLSKIIVAYDKGGNPITAGMLKADGAMALLLKDAINPNLIQTLENTPCLMHGGPFANIAHGCNSVMATKLALKLSDYVITEAGFGADLGAEKFLDIKCRSGNLSPDLIVIVATVRALKYNGGTDKNNLKEENVAALQKGLCNLGRHIENMKKFGVNVVVAINSFESDTDKEKECIVSYCNKYDVPAEFSTVFADGGNGGIKLAKLICDIADNKKSDFSPLYEVNLLIKEKIEKIALEMYRASKVNYTPKANKKIESFEKLGLDKIPVCIAKTQYSFSDDPKLLGAPDNFEITVRDVDISNGAGFIVALTGDIMTMPGLPKEPAANNIDIDIDGKIIGLF